MYCYFNQSLWSDEIQTLFPETSPIATILRRYKTFRKSFYQLYAGIFRADGPVKSKEAGKNDYYRYFFIYSLEQSKTNLTDTPS